LNIHTRLMYRLAGIAALMLCLAFTAVVQAKDVTLGDAQIEDMVSRSYQYVAMYNLRTAGRAIEPVTEQGAGARCERHLSRCPRRAEIPGNHHPDPLVRFA